MNSRRNLGLVAGVASLLSAAPLYQIFDQWTWFIQCMITVALITGTATLARSLRAPAWAQVLAMSTTLLFVLTWLYPSEDEVLALIPTPDTFAWFGSLLNQALEDMRSYGVPVPDRDGLIFLTVLGVGSVAILIDLFTVSMRRPALAGLPMLAIYSVPVAVYTESVSPTPFVVGATGYLWLLVADNVERVRRFGRRFTGDGRDIDLWEPSPLAAAGRRLAVVGVLAAIVLPLAIPDLGVGLVGRFGGGAGGEGTGRGPRMGPGAVDLFAELSGRLNQTETHQLLKVTTNEPDPYYLRFAVADQISMEGFANRQPSGRSVPRALRDPREGPVSGIAYREYRAKVEVSEDFDMPMLPVYAEPIAADGVDSSWAYDSDARIIYSNRSRSAGMTYEFNYVRAKYDPDALRRAKPLPADSPIRRNFATAPRVRAVDEDVAQLTASAGTEYDKVRAIYDSFSADRGFTYSLQTEPGTSGSHIVDFLQNKAGFCEQYAAAMAWMVRRAGIPARVAFGFTNGSNRIGSSYTLTNRNLHAWTEVYFNGFGWVPFDATPAANVAGSVVSAWAPDPNEPEEVGPSAGPSSAPGAEAGATVSPRPGGRPEEDFNGGGAPIPTPNATNWPWWTLAGVLLTALLLAIPALRRATLRRRRRARAAPSPAAAAPTAVDGTPGIRPVVMTVVADAAQARADAHAAWDELLDTMVDFRVPVDPTETPRATTERLISRASLTDAAAEGARLLGQAEERARYAKDPLRTSQLVAGLRSVRQALATAANRRQRLAAALMPPSVLLSWRLALVDLGTNAVLTVGRWRDRLGRLNPSRLSPRRRALAARTTR